MHLERWLLSVNMRPMTITDDVLPDEAALCARIKAEFGEMPGLCLTMPQAARLWHVDLARCVSALRDLERLGFLQRVGDRYMRADRGCCSV